LPRFKDSAACPTQSAAVSAHTTVLDVRHLPFWRRLPSILQAFDALGPGDAIELVVDVDPWPLKNYLQATREGAFEWRLIDDGPQLWRVRVERGGA
jgi:uncharacterized protein (DUF2249 family)